MLDGLVLFVWLMVAALLGSAVTIVWLGLWDELLASVSQPSWDNQTSNDRRERKARK
jgi:hypothetical protein